MPGSQNYVSDWFQSTTELIRTLMISFKENDDCNQTDELMCREIIDGL